MAIETLDVESKHPYTHHYVHELESILYTAIWYGVGYRDAEYPQKKKEFDYLAGWRKGTWKEVRIEKRHFLRSPWEVLSYLGKGEIRYFCSKLVFVLGKRYDAFDERKRWKLFAKPLTPEFYDIIHRALGIEATAPVPLPPQPEPPIPSKALLPKFLDVMGIVKEPWICLKDCCQEVPASA